MCYHCASTKGFSQTTAHTEMGVQMITIPELVAQALASFLTSDTRDRFGSSHARLAEVLPFAARLTLECIGNSDALYHNIEHSMLVTLAGHDILMGRMMVRPTTAVDYANFILACLTHDIGFVRGIVQGDNDESNVADLTGRTVRLPRGSSDAALAPYHVDRSKLFVSERLDGVEEVDAVRIFRAIEYTRFPYTASSNDELIEEEGMLLRAADLIGQLGDPNYLRKSNASRQGRSLAGCKSPHRQLPVFGRLAYPMRGEATNRVLLGRKSPGCPAGVFRSGRDDLGGEQTWRPEHNEISATSKILPRTHPSWAKGLWTLGGLLGLSRRPA